MIMDYSRKTKAGFEHVFFEEKKREYIAKFVALTLDILFKTKPYPCKFYQIVSHPFKFQVQKSRPFEITYAISLIPLEI